MKANIIDMAYKPYCLLYCVFFYSIFAFSEPTDTGIIFNNEYKGVILVDIKDNKPCISQELLEEWGAKSELISRLDWSASDCLIEQSAHKYDIQYWYNKSAALLTVLVPIELTENQNNRVSTSRWNDGINALFVNYQFGLTHKKGEGGWEPSGTNSNLDLSSGINLGAWRFRNKSTVWFRDNQQGTYSQESTLWRSINSIRSRLTFGESRARSTIFQSFNYKGVELISDKTMFPDNWNSFPVLINGYARTDAEVSVYQNGNQIYRIHVPAGAFSINDLFPPSPYGDIELTIKENDGAETTRVIPFSAISNILQRGKFTYEALVGRYRASRGSDIANDKFVQFGLVWGALSRVTLYSGFQGANNYKNMTTGIGTRVGNFGVLSLDVSNVNYKSADNNVTGHMFNAQYNKIIYSTGTNLNLAIQYYPKKSNWRSFEEKLVNDFIYREYEYDSGYPDRRWQARLNINQVFDEDSNLTLSWVINKKQKEQKLLHDIELSYNYSSDDFDFSLYSEYSRYSADSPADVKLGFNVSIPLSIGNRTININPISDMANRENNRNGLNINGTLFENNNDVRYDLTTTHVSHEGNELNAMLSSNYDQGSANISYENNVTNNRYHIEANGSALLYDGGLVLGQSLGNTIAVVEVPQTKGVGFYNQFNVQTNSQGQLLISNLTPWRVNTVTVDSYNLPDGLAFDNTEQTVVPTDGAIMKLQFNPTKTTGLK
ncbi:fimbria/pilus outer membrane usher protein [Providencia sp. Me31A]|uniref:fimbria/pilus outer membrane usher protein n=1 Tax=Providencia sp. Me31A TaxID=3392637 RepID=UPI003D2E97F0